MRWKLLFTFLLGCFLISCDSCQDNDDSSINIPVISEEERIRLAAVESKRIQDSIDHAEKLRIDRQRKLERKELRVQHAYELIAKFTAEYMKHNAPISGENPEYTIIDNTYNEDTETITIKFTSEWMACIQFAGCDQKEKHIFTGKLTILGDTGEPNLLSVSKNYVLQKSEEFNGAWNEFTDWLDKMEKESEDENN